MTRVLAIIAIVGAIVVVPLPAASQSVGIYTPGPPITDSPLGVGATTAAGAALLGFGYGDGYGMLTPSGAWGLVDGTGALSQVDVLTGAFMLDDVGFGAGGPAQAMMFELANAGALLTDPVQLVEQAQAQAQTLRRQRAAAGLAVERRRNPGEPEDWEMKSFSDCGDPSNVNYRARIETVDAFEVMCADAEADGVGLRIVSAYRSPQHQADLFAAAVEKYGSAQAASRWVARPRADGTCTSRHCAGIAIDLGDGAGQLAQHGEALAWTNQVVGCLTDAGTYRDGDVTCSDGTPVERHQLYGFIRPMSYEPWHIELGIPLAQQQTDACQPHADASVPEIIASVFRCELGAAGITGEDQDIAVAQALLVSQCESRWDPNAVAFGGRYLEHPHPQTGQTYTATGLFQLTRTTGDRYIDGGWANATDPVANADAAARLYLDDLAASGDGWSSWACAQANDGFTANSVLPGYPGGPDQYPSWVWSY